jgi:mannose-1-phosphate guanylyltransferase
MNQDRVDLVAVIMAGGAGTRFWPLSTEQHPKQFLKLFDDRSLLQKSFDRITDLVPPERVLVLTNMSFVDLVREQLPEIPSENVIGEPVRRDTGAAVCLGALLCRRRFGNPIIATLTADHMIEPVDVFQKTLLSAARLAGEGGVLYTFGVRPTYAATGYGYLELGAKVADVDGVEHFTLESFKEKPDQATAGQYVSSGGYLWNSGMFVWTAGAILQELERHLPDHLTAIAEAVELDGTSKWPRALRTAFESVRTISVDYGVMEKAREVRCVAATFSWTDVGGWQALGDFLERDEKGNRHRGRIMPLNAGGNLVFCEDPEEIVMLVGVDNLVAVRAGNRTLIAHQEQAEEIKKLVQSLQAASTPPR